MIWRAILRKQVAGSTLLIGLYQMRVFRSSRDVLHGSNAIWPPPMTQAIMRGGGAGHSPYEIDDFAGSKRTLVRARETLDAAHNSIVNTVNSLLLTPES